MREFLALVAIFSCGVAEFHEELTIQPLISIQSPPATSPPPLLLSYVFSHSRAASPQLSGTLPADDFFPAPWDDFLADFNVTRALSAFSRGALPPGWRAPSRAGGAAPPLPASLPQGALLRLAFGGAPAGAALWATWDRAARRLAVVTGAAVTGPAAVARGPAFAGAPYSTGLQRDWFAHAGGAGEVELAAPRGGACTGAFWGLVASAPCRARAGLAAALQPAALLGAPWHSVSWRAVRECAGSACALNLTVEAHVVMAAVGAGGGGGDGGDVRAALALPEDWGDARPAECPLAASSGLRLGSEGGGRPAALPLAALAPAGGGGAHPRVAAFFSALRDGTPPPAPPPRGVFDCLSAARQLVADAPALGSGLVLLQVHNDCPAGAHPPLLREVAALLEVREALPWFFSRVVGSGMWWVSGPGGGAAAALAEPAVLAGAPGGRPRGPAALLLTADLPLPPAGATLSVSWRYAPAPHGLLHSEEGPPDAARGVEFPPARLRVAGTEEGAEWWVETLTGGGVVQLPAADASMPYNVMVLASTVAAFIAGGLINALARAPKTPPPRAVPP